MEKILTYNEPRPGWLRKPMKITPEVLKIRRMVARLKLHTVCESAHCPNLSECYKAGNATFMILGNHCTRNCLFCAVEHDHPLQPDPEEGQKIIQFIKAMSIHFAVITSVTRDDLEDKGAGQFIKVVLDIKAALPKVLIELLVPDFKGRTDLIRKITNLPIAVFAHNMETVRSLYPQVREMADYDRSLYVLKSAFNSLSPGTLLKSGIMVGLGERSEELDQLFHDIAECGVDILTIGQYMRPGSCNLPVERYYTPDEFNQLKSQALSHGLKKVVSGPYIRSSYLAEINYMESLRKNV